ncbi:MAG TPA: HipA domain-containing protein [Trebonia sp.]
MTTSPPVELAGLAEQDVIGLLRAYGRNVAGLSRSGIPTSPRLFKFVVVSVAVGNLDMHAKNISLLHRPDGTMTLSPAYVLRLANTEIPHKRANAELAGDISGFASNLLAGRVIGASHWHR